MRLVRVTRATGGGAGRDAAGAGAGRVVGVAVVVAVDALAGVGATVDEEDAAGRIAAGRGRATVVEFVASGLLAILFAGLLVAALAARTGDPCVVAPIGVLLADPGAWGVVDAVPGAFTSITPCPLAAAASRRDALACRAAAVFFAMLFPPTLKTLIYLPRCGSAPALQPV